MAAIRGLSLPYGTKVRMTCDFCSFRTGDIITRTYGNCDIDDNSRFDSDNDYEYLPDSHWELIEEPKEDWLIQDTNGNLTKSDSFQMPKQGDKVQVGEVDGFWYNTLYEFVCFYKNKVVVEKSGACLLYNHWRFPQEEVTLSDGNTYLVEERGEEKILKLKI